MTAPTPYELDYSFQGFQIVNPDRPLPADKLEVEFNAISLTTDEIIANLGLIQRADGELSNESVGYDQLKDELQLGLPQPTVWITATAYAIRDAVFNGSSLYRAVTAHTSGVFATDLAAGKWELLINLAATGPVITFNGRAGVVVPLTGDYAAFYQPLDADLTSIAAIATTSYGRSFLALADAAAAQTLAGLVIGTNVQAQGATLTSLEALSLVSGDIIYATGADALVRLPKGTDGQFLGLVSGIPDWETVSSSGDVVGPASATDNAVVRFDSTTGKLVKNSGVIVDNSNNVTFPAENTFTNTGVHILDTNASHDLIIKPGSDLTADRILTITTGDAARTLTLNADVTLDFGTYTPTLTNGANVAASTAYLCQWFRIGSMVTVSGKVDIDVTTGAGTQTNLGMSLPVASNFAAAENAGGTAISVTNPQIYGIQADAANDRADFSGQISNTTNLSYAFSFTYRII